MSIIFTNIHHWKKNLIYSLTIVALSGIGVISGMIPELSTQSYRLNYSLVAQAQDYSVEDISNYARSVLLMESYRRQAYRDIRQIIGAEPPEIICSDKKSFKNLSPEAAKIAKDYCKTARQIIQNSGLTISEFNTITTNAQSDQNLERQIQNAMMEIQRQQKK